MSQPNDSPPIRTCIGCRQRRPQAELVRVVLDADGRAQLDPRGDGRGAYLCGGTCLTEAVRRRAFDRAWRTRVQPWQYEHLHDQLDT